MATDDNDRGTAAIMRMAAIAGLLLMLGIYFSGGAGETAAGLFLLGAMFTVPAIFDR